MGVQPAFPSPGNTAVPGGGAACHATLQRVSLATAPGPPLARRPRSPRRRTGDRPSHGQQSHVCILPAAQRALAPAGCTVWGPGFEGRRAKAQACARMARSTSTCSRPHTENCSGAPFSRKYAVLKVSPLVHMSTILMLQRHKPGSGDSQAGPSLPPSCPRGKVTTCQHQGQEGPSAGGPSASWAEAGPAWGAGAGGPLPALGAAA